MSDSPPGTGIFDMDRIRRLVELMKEHDLKEIDLQEDDQRIRLCRTTAETGFLPQMMPAPVYQQMPQSIPQGTPAAGESKSPAADAANIIVIKSPMVGTFYLRPNPKSEAFVKVGDHIESSTTICIIEAMKVFNEIPAEVSGKVVAILVGDEEPVDFGKPLFKIETSK